MSRHSFAALRGMLLAVPDEIERRAGGAAAGLDPAALARARAIARAIATPPEPPAALRDPAFLGAIHDHAARTVARALGPSILRRAFPPTPVPR
ncbi:MAG TPA: hypothetical protein VK081_02570, partial [Planctomycetota bacterium]|nr:hypothetical protein [Planctomycetota bacterium]